jgi:hypothetical protein
VKKAAIEAALKNIQAIPAEVKDVTLSEGVEIAMHVVSEIPGIIEAFKGK